MIALVADLVRSRRGLVLGVCAGLLLVSIGYLAMYPSFEDQLKAFADDIPDAYRALLGDVDIASAEGYIRSQVYSLIAPLVMASAAISAGSGLARAERDQTLAVLAVTPLSRRQLVGSWGALVWMVSLIAAVVIVVGVMIGIPLAGADVGADRVMLATLPQFLFAGLIGSISLLVATITGAPGTARGAGWIAVLVSFVMNSMSELVDSLGWMAEVSPWSWHGAGQAITAGADNRSIALLVVSSVIVCASALVRFERRNLHL